MTPRGRRPAVRCSADPSSGCVSAEMASRHEPGPSDGSPRCRRKTAPPERSASEARRPSGPSTPSKVSPAEWATMNQGGTPAATRAPIIDPAEVPTMRSALPGSQPVSSAIAARPPVSHAPPRTPPAPSTNPTLTTGHRTPGPGHPPTARRRWRTGYSSRFSSPERFSPMTSGSRGRGTPPSPTVARRPCRVCGRGAPAAARAGPGAARPRW